MKLRENSLIFCENVLNMDETEILQYLLSFTNKKQAEVLASSLIEKFGSLKCVLEARPEQLRTVAGIGPRTADMIAAFLPMVRTWNRISMEDPCRVKCTSDAERYCKSILAGLRHEEFWIICLNAQCKVIGKRKISSGSLSEVEAYPRVVMEAALNYNAHSVLFTHNHPGGTLAPSMVDITSTIKLKKLLNEVGIDLLDHIIVCNNATYSMLVNGDIAI